MPSSWLNTSSRMSSSLELCFGLFVSFLLDCSLGLISEFLPSFRLTENRNSAATSPHCATQTLCRHWPTCSAACSPRQWRRLESPGMHGRGGTCGHLQLLRTCRELWQQRQTIQMCWWIVQSLSLVSPASVNATRLGQVNMCCCMTHLGKKACSDNVTKEKSIHRQPAASGGIPAVLRQAGAGESTKGAPPAWPSYKQSRQGRDESTVWSASP